MASYTDNGNPPIKPITSRKQINLRYAKLKAAYFDDASKDVEATDGKVREIYNNTFLHYKKLDFTDIESISISYKIREDIEYGGTIEVYLNDHDGPLIGKVQVKEDGKSDFKLSDITGFHDLYLTLKTPTVIIK